MTTVKIFYATLKYHQSEVRATYEGGLPSRTVPAGQEVINDFFLSIKDAFMFQKKHTNSTMNLEQEEVQIDSLEYQRALQNVCSSTENIPEGLIEPTN